MLRELPRKRSVGLGLALLATAISGTSVLAAPAPVDATSDHGPAIIVYPPTWMETWPYEVNPTTIRSPQTGLNVRVPGINSPPESPPDTLPWLPQPLEQPGGSITVGSPQNGLNVRVPAF